LFGLLPETVTAFDSPAGVAVGAGWQRIVAYVNITTYYFIGIPIGAILGYVLGYHVKVRYLISLEEAILTLNRLLNSLSLFIVAVSSGLNELYLAVDTGYLGWHAAWNTSPNYRAFVHNK
jgi:Na+-driven multidrug efflux pump